MNAADRKTIEKLLAFLPQFESGEHPTTERDNFFMEFHDVAAHEFRSENYIEQIEKLGGWDCLKDLELIRRAGWDDLRAILTALLRSERWCSYDYSGSVWREYNNAGSFMAVLNRLAELENGG